MLSEPNMSDKGAKMRLGLEVQSIVVLPGHIGDETHDFLGQCARHCQFQLH